MDEKKKKRKKLLDWLLFVPDSAAGCWRTQQWIWTTDSLDQPDHCYACYLHAEYPSAWVSLEIEDLFGLAMSLLTVLIQAYVHRAELCVFISFLNA